MTAKLTVFIAAEEVGALWLDASKRFCFQYGAAWLNQAGYPLSLSLPLRAEPYVDDEAHAFFANLLPEQAIREVIARNLGLSVGNDFGLLERIGGDCAGAVSLYPAGSGPAQEESGYRDLGDAELSEIIRELPRKPLLAGEQGVRLSLAGAQKKLPVLYRQGHFALGLGHAASSHIIKPTMEMLDGTVENEAFCMRLADRLGLEVPSSFIFSVDELKLFVVERYDRRGSSSEIQRLHQEDFCQALGFLPEFKYEAEGGPTLAGCFALLRAHSIRPGRDVLSLLKWVVFNALIENADAHGKNISLLFLPEGPVLAPFYDLLSTAIYAHYGVAEGMAMKIGGENIPTSLQRKDWERFAAEVQIKPALVINQVLTLAQHLRTEGPRLFRGEFADHQCDALHRLVERVVLQAEKTVNKLS